MKLYFRILLLLFSLLIFSESKSQTLLLEDFEGSFPPSGWTLDNPGFVTPFTQNTFVLNAASGSKSMRCYASSYSVSNAWAFTPALSLTTNTLYRISYYYRGSTSSGYSEKMKVTIGSSATVAGQTTVVHDYTNITSTSFAQGIDTITVPANGNYNFAFNYYSNANQAAIYIDYVVIQQIAATPCTGGVPSIGVASGPSIVASNNTFNLALSGNYLFYSGLQFKWQSSLQAANNFQDIPGANTQNYSTSQTVAKDYRCVMTCVNSATSVNSNIVSVSLPNSGSLFREKYAGSTNINRMINGMSFLTPSTGFVAFADSVGFTQDSGQSYIKRAITIANTNYNGYSVNLTFGYSVRGVHAFSQDSLLLYGDYGAEPAILFSGNQGLNWKVVFHQPFSLNPDIGNSFFDMKFQTAANGIALNQKYIVETTNRGQNWSVTSQIPSYRSSKFAKLSIPSSTAAYAIAGDYLYRKAGSYWQEGLYSLPQNGGLNYNNLSFSSASTGYIAKDNNLGVYKTTNGGTNWTLMNDTLLNPVLAADMYFINDSTGLIASKFSYDVLKTTDNGITWELCKKNSNFQTGNYGMNRLFFLNSQTGWAGGRGEYLMITTSSGSPTIPKALFRIDTTNLTASGNVNLISLSKQYYQHKWYKNGVLISTAVNTSYVHNIFVQRDTIQLVVGNAVDSDTLELYQDFPIPVLPPPVISSFTPAFGINGTSVNISGTNFLYTTEVRFGGVPALSFVVNAANSITAVVGVGTSGHVKVVTHNGRDSLNGFVHNGPPAITSFYPNEGGPGTPISIYGLNFTNVSAISFGGTAALSFQVISPVLIKAFVNTGSSGNISVTTNNGNVMASGFTFIPRPTIDSLSPQVGPIGTVVSIFGTNFSNQADSNIVFFGAARANVLTAAATKLTVRVPLGTTYSPVTVTTKGLTAFHNKPFHVTFPGGGSVFLPTSFADKVDIPTGYSPWSVSITDIDSDGKPDVLTGIEYGYVSAYKNNSGAGTFAFPPYVNFQTGGAAYNLATGDLNGDGKPDVVSANNTGGNASILRNLSTLNNISFAGKVDLAIGHQARSAVIADFDLDGKPDIAVSNNEAYAPGYYMVSMFRNTGFKDTIYFAPKVNIQSSGYYSIKSADFDGDGKTDIVTNTIAVLKNNSTLGNFSFTLDLTSNDGDYQDIAIGDINGDNKPDIVATKNSSDYIAIFINNSTPGSISFLPKISYTVGNLPQGIGLADMDGDGKIDIVLNTNNTNTINGERTLLLKNTTVSGIVSFASQVEYYTPGVRAVEIGDLDMDGKPDIASNSGFGYISILRNKVGDYIGLCPGGNTTLLSSLNGSSYQWQLSTDSINFNNISNNTNYNNVNTNILSLMNVPSNWHGYQYRCLVDGNYSEKFTIGITNTWTGSTSNAWENPSNWSCRSVPDSNTDVRIPSGIIVINSNVIIRSLLANPAVSITLNSGYTLTITH